MSNSYHCDLRYLQPVAHWHDLVDFRPFKNAQDMTLHLGISVEQWMEKQRLANLAKASRVSGEGSSSTLLEEFKDLL